MINKMSFLCVFLLIFCLLAVGCGKDTDTAPTGDKIIYAPTFSDTDGKVQGTESNSDSGADTETDAEADTEAESAAEADTTAQSTTDNDALDEPTEITDTPVTDFAADPIVPDENTGIIDLGDILLSGETVTGRIVSEQSDKIRLVLTYYCQPDIIGNVTIEYEVGLECYDINCGARADLGTITLDGVTHTFSTGEIVNSTGTRVYVPFTKYVYQSRIGQTSCTVDISWEYNGVYAGTNIDTLTAGAIIMWDTSN